MATVPSATSESMTGSEIRYRRLFETARDGILILDAETGLVEEVNPYLTGLLEYPNESIINKAIWELGFLSEVFADTDNFRELQQSEYLKFDNLLLDTARGRQVPVEFTGNIYFEGNRKLIQCNIRDLSGRRLTDGKKQQSFLIPESSFNPEEDLAGTPTVLAATGEISQIRLSEEKFSKLFHINPAACSLSDLESKGYIEVNESFCSLFGFSRGEIIGKTAVELGIIAGADWTSLLRNIDPDRNVVNAEAALKGKTGMTKHVLYSSETIYIQDRQYRFSVINDITARKLVEIALAESKSRLELVMVAGNIAWWEMEKSTGKITFAKNKAVMLGYPPEQFSHYTDFMKLVHPDDVHRTMTAMRKHFAGLADKYETDYRILDKSGVYQWFHDIGSVVKWDSEGKPLVVSGLVLNITGSKQAEIALRNNEVRMHTLVQTIPDLVWLKDTDGVYLSCNRMFERFFGATEADIIGKTDYDFVTHDQAEGFRRNDRNALAAQKPQSNEEWISSADDGTRVYLDTIKTPMYDSEGKLTGVLGISHDITRLKQVETDLRESEEKFKSIYEGSHDAITLMDHTGFFDCNPRTLEMFGLQTKSDFLGLHPSDVSPSFQQDGRASVESADEKINSAMVTGLNQFDWIHRRSNGDEFPVKVTLSSFNLQGKPVIQATIRDITTIEYQLIAANSELLFQNAEKENRAAELKVANTELAYQNKEKESRAAELKIANTELAFQNDEKENRAAELKIANTELAFQNSEKEKRAIELEVAKEKAEESDKLKTAFLQNMSHEIRTPLNGIIGFSALLNEENLRSDEIKDFTSMISQSGKRLIEIVNNVLDISKIQTGQLKLNQAHISVNSIFLDLFAFFNTLAKAKQISLSYHNQENIFRTIYTDEAKLHQILTNLINNAIKFTKSGCIDFGFEIAGKTITFYVKDTGIGIPKALYDRIFDRFIQAEQSLTKTYEGAGLGLAISKGLVELLGGRIWVESEVNRGTTFFFTLPYETIKVKPSTIINAREIVKRSIRGKVLVAEDDWISYMYLNKILLKLGITVIHAENGKQAVEKVMANPDISLILMDIKMPEMNGIEAIKLIKSTRPDIPVIAQTAYAFEEEKLKILSTGCNEYLVKPVTPGNLKAIINKYLKTKDKQGHNPTP